MLEICIREKHFKYKLCSRKSNLTRVLNFSSTNRRGHGVLFQSFSEALSAEEERNLVENATDPKVNACSDGKMVVDNFSRMAEW